MGLECKLLHSIIVIANGSHHPEEPEHEAQEFQPSRGPRLVQASAFPTGLCCAFLLCVKKNRISTIRHDNTSPWDKIPVMLAPL